MKLKNRLFALRNKVGVSAVAVGGLVASGVASAQDDFSTGVLAELSGGHTQILAICGAIIALIALILLFKLVKRSAG